MKLKKLHQESVTFTQALRRDLSAPSSAKQKAYIAKMQAASEGSYSVGVPVKLRTGEVGLISFVKSNTLEVEKVTGGKVTVSKDQIEKLISMGEYLRLRRTTHESMNLSQTIRKIIREELQASLQNKASKAKPTSEVFGLEKHGRGDDQMLRKYQKDAEAQSKAGHVVHVNKTAAGFELSDMYDADSTVASYENGKKLNEQGDVENLMEKKEAIATSPHTNVTLHFDEDFKQVGESGGPESTFTISVSSTGGKEFFRSAGDSEESAKLAQGVRLELRRALRRFDKHIALILQKYKYQSRL